MSVLSLPMKRRLYIYVKSAMLYGNKTWLVEDDDVQRLGLTEKTIVRWMFNTIIRNYQASAKF